MGTVDLDAAREFIRRNPRAVLSARRSDGSPQMSPVLATVDDEGRVVISTRETAYKVRQVRRDPRVALCFFTEGFFGDWLQVEGTATVLSLPEAMEPLVDLYRRISGEHRDWDEYRAAMVAEKRVVLRVVLERAGPDVSG
ncbi:PPOX class F420-dependent oxidoreductase [Saccharothrix syringae]|uniref:PPOX class F420-dependent oxidoreductase n=1 Tax=Saccharothrix syringae TaxID=103733 RepID=UPI001B802E80|nr:PPOX class F420-dependent oxidoreductase [Saccharothrix syringae]